MDQSTGVDSLISHWVVLHACLQSLGTAAVMAGAGFVLSRRGLLTPVYSKGLAKISMNLTIPCLLFSTVVDCDQNHSPAPCPRVEANIRNGWPLLLLPVVNVSVGLLIGFFNTCLFKPPQDFRRAATAAVAFGNSTGMPITLLSVIYNTLSSRAPLGSVDPVFYLSVYLLVYPVLTWGIGGVLMGIGSTDQPANDGPPSRLEHYAPGSDTGSLEAPLLERDPERGGKWCLDVSSLQAVMVRVRGFVSATFQPPVVASLIGMLIAVTPARGIFVDVVTRNGDAPLQFLTDGIMRIRCPHQHAHPRGFALEGCRLDDGAMEPQPLHRSVQTLCHAGGWRVNGLPAEGLPPGGHAG
uniref:Auxin efflux carrier family protein n=1 Tax=Tetraselmis sp. GSL018 TaxID=582737 RepID=A0A061R2L1_9CHLO